MRICLLLVVSTLASRGGPAHISDPIGEVEFAGFFYQAPGFGWRAVIYPPNENGNPSHDYLRDGFRFQVQVSTFKPIVPVRDEAALIAWLIKPNIPKVDLENGHGATCARFAYRWNQTLSLGGPAAPWATFDERDLYCIDPIETDHLLQFRVLERLSPGEATTPGFDAMAEKLIGSVRARAP